MTAIRQIPFFALKNDLLAVVETVEHGRPLKYVRTGQFDCPESDSFGAGAEIPGLGTASADSSVNNQSFLVTNGELPVNWRRITTNTGVQRYCLDQLANPESITFTPSGRLDEGVVISGRVGTASDSPIAQELMRRFRAAFKKHFTKVRAYWVGPEALALLQAGKRLADATQSPRNTTW